jgi:hypothetical protein
MIKIFVGVVVGIMLASYVPDVATVIRDATNDAAKMAVEATEPTMLEKAERYVNK